MSHWNWKVVRYSPWFPRPRGYRPYDIVTAPTAADGWPFWMGLFFQGLGVLGTFYLGFQIWKQITSSGILNSNWGAAVVLLGVSTTAALGGIGLLFG